MPNLTIRRAVDGDLVTLQQLIQRSYRGDSARAGWTHEADLLDDERIGLRDLQAIVGNPAERILIAYNDTTQIGCVRIADLGAGLAYLGLLCVDPLLQGAGCGKELIAAAEHRACEDFGACRMEMTVIESRAELLAYYGRRGYTATTERRDFPVPLDPPLYMAVLEKALT